MLMPGAPETDAALAANVIVRASFDSVIPGKTHYKGARRLCCSLYFLSPFLLDRCSYLLLSLGSMNR